jgi:hypothetical protein
MAWHRSNNTSKRLDAIPGVEPAPAIALAAGIADLGADELWPALAPRLWRRRRRRRRFELERPNVTPHGVHDHCELARDRGAMAVGITR